MRRPHHAKNQAHARNPDKWTARISAESLQEDLPEIFQPLVQDCFSSPLRLTLRSALLPDGRFGESWLVVSDRKLAVFALEKNQPRCCDTVELSASLQLKIENGVGADVLEWRDGEASHRLLTFPESRRALFATAIKILHGFLTDGQWHLDRLAPAATACRACGAKVPPGTIHCRKCRWKGIMLRKVLTYAWPYRRLALGMFLLMIAGSAAGLIGPYLGKFLVDQILTPRENLHLLAPLVLAMVASGIVQALLDCRVQILSSRIGSGAIHDIRSRMFQRLQELSLEFYARRETGMLISRVNQDTEQLKRLIVDFVPYGVHSLLTATGILGLLFFLSWRLTLIELIPLAAMVIFARFAFPRLTRYWNRFLERRSRLTAYVNDVLTGIRVVKVFSSEEHEINRFSQRSGQFRDASIDAEVALAKVIPVLHILAMLGPPIVWFVGGSLVFKEQMSLGGIIAYIGYLMMLFRPLFIMTRLAQQIPNTLAAAERVFDIIDAEPEITDAPDAVDMPEIRGHIELRGVQFAYEPHQPIIKDLSLEIRPGEFAGLVGHSGAGKTTTINLLCRLYDVDDGQILLDGVDIRRIKRKDLLRHIGMVPQETFLFNGSIAENIAYARPGASPLEIIRAARVANAHHFIMNRPDGYDTEITGGGNNLSVGEKQRIAIARAVLSDPKILILDEATGNVDIRTEKEIQDALARLAASRTTVAIAHRLSTLRQADRLFVLKQGELAESGSHQELIARDGVYAELVRLQQETSHLAEVPND